MSAGSIIVTAIGIVTVLLIVVGSLILVHDEYQRAADGSEDRCPDPATRDHASPGSRPRVDRPRFRP